MFSMSSSQYELCHMSNLLTCSSHGFNLALNSDQEYLLRNSSQSTSELYPSQLKFARGKGADRGTHGRFRADRGRLGRGQKFRPVIGED